MNLIEIAGQVSRDTDQNTTNLLNQVNQFSKGQNDLQKIKLQQEEEKRERAKRRHELEDIQRIQELSREVEDLKSKLRRLEHRCDVTRDLAADVILDRTSILYAAKAVMKCRKDGMRLEDLISLFDSERKEEKSRIAEDDDRQNTAYKLVDDVVSGWMHPSSTRRRRPPGHK